MTAISYFLTKVSLACAILFSAAVKTVIVYLLAAVKSTMLSSFGVYNLFAKRFAKIKLSRFLYVTTIITYKAAKFLTVAEDEDEFS